MNQTCRTPVWWVRNKGSFATLRETLAWPTRAWGEGRGEGGGQRAPTRGCEDNGGAQGHLGGTDQSLRKPAVLALVKDMAPKPSLYG